MTAQNPELIYIDNNLMALCEEPLESYFQKTGRRPKLIWLSTALKRGYKGIWRIENEQLFLIHLQLYLEDETDDFFDWRTLFPDQTEDIKASWYTGTLRIPHGKLIHYVHGGYLSVYEKDLFIKVVNGDVIERKIVENKAPETKKYLGLFDIFRH